VFCLKPSPTGGFSERRTMLADQFAAAAAAARNTYAVDEIARLTWRAHAEGQLAEAEATAISEAIAARRAAFATGRASLLPPSPTRPTMGHPKPARRPPRSPARRASIERRRRQMMSGVVPARIAASFTPAELAALTVIGRECQRRQVCTLPIDQIAAMAGCCRTSVQNALRRARLLGLLDVKERRISGSKSLPNVVKVISTEWSAWLKLGGQRIGFKMLSPTDSLSPSGGWPRTRPSSTAGRAFGETQP
jgi:hypothetical protein